MAADDLADGIVDAAIAEAEVVGWDNVRLRRVAAALGIDMAVLGRRFRDLDAVADAWFDRARLAMLAAVDEDLAARPARDRLYRLFCCWLDALAPHRRVTVDMLKHKMWPFHPHHWVPMIFNLSRTILWVRDGAGLDAKPPRREIEEVALTWLFLATLAVWSTDDTPGQQRTKRFLERRLADADHLVTLVCGRGRAPAAAGAGDPTTPVAPPAEA
ncbi:MAG: TetR/AcrR family transcriptional regulator [Rhodospirillales bacterium]|nr:MAG: TetR/AcrR family transcriptional regulator [Rhodospirillales bacterium]